jgi:hypothetical protein
LLTFPDDAEMAEFGPYPDIGDTPSFVLEPRLGAWVHSRIREMISVG